MKKLYKLFFLTVIFLIAETSFAGNPIDTTFIKSFKQNYVFQADIYNKKLSFSINPKSQFDSIKSRIIKYNPNVDNYFGISLSYKGWGLGLSVKLPNSRLSDSIYGKTNFSDYKFSLHKRKFGGTAFLKYYQGFYLSNPGLFDTAFIDGVVPHRSDLVYGTVGFNAYYLFNNKRFSMKSLFSQNERQKKTAATFLIQSDFHFSFIESDSSLIPSSDEKYYIAMKGFQDMYMYSASMMAGYAHNNIISDYYYICPMFSVGPGYQYRMFNTENGVINGSNFFIKSNFKFAAGYNADVAYMGMLLDIDSNLMPAHNVNLKSTTFTLNFFVGYRFW